MSSAVAAKLRARHGAFAQDNSGYSFPPGDPSVEQALTPPIWMLLIVLRGTTVTFSKVVLRTRNQPSAPRIADRPRRVDGSGHV
jgi:hypothetical protein